MKQKLFETKKILFTNNITVDVIQDSDFSEFIFSSLSKHFINEGEECKSDNEYNLENICNNKGNVLSSFKYKDKKIYVITDCLGLEYLNQDYPYTTVLYDYEY